MEMLYTDGRRNLYSKACRFWYIAWCPYRIASQTDASGNWCHSVPTGSDYLILEFLPFTGSGTARASGFIFGHQTAPVAGRLRGLSGFYVGKRHTEIQTGLDFGRYLLQTGLSR
jgi:hypothetical protein